MDIWTFNNQGNIVNQIEDKTKDSFYKVDENHEKISNELKFNYGTVSFENNLIKIGEIGYSFDSFHVNNREDAKTLYEFMASETDVEWGKTDVTSQTNSNESSVITTSNMSNMELGTSFLPTMLWFKKLGLGINSITHSHPGGTETPSDYIDNGVRKGDVPHAIQMRRKYVENIKFNLYIPQKNKYVPYANE